MTPWRMEPKRVHRFARSRGPAFVGGAVDLFDGQPVLGATVRFGCETTMTWSRVPSYELELSAGHYEGEATADRPATQQKLTGRRLVNIQPGDQPAPIDIETEGPAEVAPTDPLHGQDRHSPDSRDRHRRLVAHRDLAASHLTWAPSTWGEPPGGASVKTWKPHVMGKHAQRFNVRVDLTLTLREDLALDVLARATLCENYYKDAAPPTGDQIVVTKEHVPVTIARNGVGTFTFDLASVETAPPRDRRTESRKPPGACVELSSPRGGSSSEISLITSSPDTVKPLPMAANRFSSLFLTFPQSKVLNQHPGDEQVECVERLS